MKNYANLSIKQHKNETIKHKISKKNHTFGKYNKLIQHAKCKNVYIYLIIIDG